VLFSQDQLMDLIARHSYLAVGLAVGLESMGLPLPGETLLIAAALYAAQTNQIDINTLVAVTALAAIMGDNLGYLIGRVAGFPLLRRYGRYVYLTPERLAVGQALFARHGGKVVLFGRFFSLLRVLAALLAGANRMPWWRFLIANAVGGIIWAAAFGYGAHALGHAIEDMNRLGMAALAAVVAAVAVAYFWRRRQAARRA